MIENDRGNDELLSKFGEREEVFVSSTGSSCRDFGHALGIFHSPEAFLSVKSKQLLFWGLLLKSEAGRCLLARRGSLSKTYYPALRLVEEYEV